MRQDAVLAPGFLGRGLDLALGDHIDNFTHADFFLGGDIGGGQIRAMGGELGFEVGGVAGDDAGALRWRCVGGFSDDDIEDADDDTGDDEPVEFAQRGVDLFEGGFRHVHASRESLAAVLIAKEGAFTASDSGFEFGGFMAHRAWVKSNADNGIPARLGEDAELDELVEAHNDAGIIGMHFRQPCCEFKAHGRHRWVH